MKYTNCIRCGGAITDNPTLEPGVLFADRYCAKCREVRRKESAGQEPIVEVRHKHTPGPWHRNIKPASKYPVVFAGRSTHVAVVSTQGLTDEEIEGNCNLISATTDLLEALRLLQKAVHDAHLLNVRKHFDICVADAAASKAIAKAEGRQ